MDSKSIRNDSENIGNVLGTPNNIDVHPIIALSHRLSPYIIGLSPYLQWDKAIIQKDKAIHINNNIVCNPQIISNILLIIWNCVLPLSPYLSGLSPYLEGDYRLIARAGGQTTRLWCPQLVWMFPPPTSLPHPPSCSVIPMAEAKPSDKGRGRERKRTGGPQPTLR